MARHPGHLAAVLAVLAACGGAPAPAVSHSAPAAPAVQDAGAARSDLEDCEDDTVALTRGTIDVQICAHMDEYDHREQTATMTLEPTLGPPITMELGRRTDGIETTTTWRLAGFLTAPNGDQAVVIQVQATDLAHDSNSIVEHHDLRIYQIRDHAFTLVHDLTAVTLDPTFAPDNRVATVAGCIASHAAHPAGCGDDADAEPMPPVELRWDGVAVSRRPAPAPAP